MAIFRFLQQVVKVEAEAAAQRSDGPSRVAFAGAAVVVVLASVLLFGI